MSTETIDLLCLCDEEWCYCTETVTVPLPTDGRAPDVPCPQCEAGHHVDPEGVRR